MAWVLYDYVNQRPENEFRIWSSGLQKHELAKLNARLDLLEQHGPELLPKMLAGPIRGQPHLYKLVINGRIALRPILCKGPVDMQREFTLLMGATERGFEWVPRDAPASAEVLRQHVIDDPSHRRCLHEPVLRAP
jgi:hypothetical protein